MTRRVLNVLPRGKIKARSVMTLKTSDVGITNHERKSTATLKFDNGVTNIRKESDNDTFGILSI